MSKINFRGKSAADILRETGQENSIPVNLNEILHKLGISAIAMDFSNIESMMPEYGHILGAMLTTKEGNTAIFYSSDQTRMPDHRYRFTIAHELGHCCIDGKGEHIEFRRDVDADNESERKANIFAGELLIPLHQLEQVSRELFLPTLKNLAAVFEVSETVMLARLKHLKRTDLYI